MSKIISAQKNLVAASKAFALILGLGLLAAPAHASVMPGQICTDIGTTQMSDDKANIVACMLVTGNTGANADCANVTGGCEWKAMTAMSTLKTYTCTCSWGNSGTGCSCAKACPSGMTMVSGGGYANNWASLQVSRPSGNGWSCEATDASNSDAQSGTLDCYVLCQ